MEEKRYYYKDKQGNHYNYKEPHFLVDKEVLQDMTFLKENGEEITEQVPVTVKVLDDNYTELTKEEFISETTPPQPTQEQLEEMNRRSKLNKELNELLQWFEKYDIQVAQYNRCQRLGIHFVSSMGTIEEIDALAVEKANRINEIKKLL